MVAAAGASDSKIDNLRASDSKLDEISENEKAVHHTLPNSYVRAEAERSRLDEVVPVVDLTNPDRAAVVAQIEAACSSHGFFQWLPAVADDFFRLSPVERAKLYFDDPAKKMRLPTSLEDWLEQFVPEFEQFVPEFSDVVGPYFNQVRELGFRIYAAIWENPRTKAPMINLTDQLQIVKNEDLEQLGILGSGAFGTVYRAKWKGTDVAVKRFRTFPSSEQAQEFWREADILSKLRHPNVVAFYGVVKDGPGDTQLATLTEFMVNGSLGDVLRSKDKGRGLRKRLIIATDAAFGMEYLHSKNIVHFDLKSDNLLVNLRDHARPICKVADFGLSKIKRNTMVSGGLRGTLPWIAPELLNGTKKVSEKVDVFSFGIVMWEILTGKVPYDRMHEGAIIGGVVNNTLRPLVPANCGPEWRMLMEQCWSPDPAARPAFTEIAARLRSMSAAANQQAKAAK